MKNVDTTYDAIIRLNHMSIYLDKDIFEANKNIILEHREKLLAKVNCSNYEEYMFKMRSLVRSKNYSPNLYKYCQKHNIGIEEAELAIEKSKIIKNLMYIKLMKVFTKLISLQLLENDIFNKNIYLPWFIDLRERIYARTVISPTFNKPFRFLFKLTNKEEFINLESSEYYKRIIQYNFLIKNYNLNNLQSYVLIVLFIEIGKFSMKKIEGYIKKTEDIIKLGIYNYNNQNLDFDFEDKIYINNIYCALKQLINNGIIDNNTMIHKDATASGLQNFGIIYGYKIDKLWVLNMLGLDHIDTYMYVIMLFMKNYPELAKFMEEHPELKDRSMWKNMIMTIPYNATKPKSFGRYKERLLKVNINYKILEKEIQNKYTKIHNFFMISLKMN